MEYAVRMKHIVSLSSKYFVVYAGLTSLLALCTYALPTHAMVIRGGDAYTVHPETQLEGDLYFLGKTLDLMGSSTNDVVAGASVVTLEGSVSQDVWAVAGVVDLYGSVGGDARVVAGEFSMATGTIAEDLVVVGGTIVIGEGAVVAGDVLVYGDRLVIEGTVQGNVEAHVGTLELKGTVGHDLNVSARESVAMTERAHVAGTFAYRAPRAAFISETTSVGGETIPEIAPDDSDVDGAPLLSFLLSLFMAGVAGVVTLLFMPRYAEQVVERTLRVGVFGVATGLIMLVAFPVVALVVCVTIIGLAPGLLTFFAYGSALILTYMLTPVLAGAVLARWLKRGSGLRWDWVVLGAGSLSLISFLPMIGGIIHTILFLSIFSVVVTSAYEALMAHRKAPTPPAVLPEHPIEAHDTGVESKHESS